MLQSLRNIPSQEAQRILVVLTEEFLQKPLKEKLSYEIDPTIFSETLSEVRKRTYVRDGDNSEKAKAKILTFLSNEVSQLILTPYSRKKAKERLGENGVLPLTEYELIFEKNFDYFKALGVKETYVKAVIQSPDKLYHDENLRIPSTLIASRVDPGSGKEPFILLCHARRHQSSLMINSAWNLYESDINLPDNYTLLDLLKSFIKKYGFFVQMLGSEKVKFVNYAYAPTYSDVRPYVLDPAKFIFLENKKKYFANAMLRRSPAGPVELFYIFAVDIEKYIETLLGHGVSVNVNFVDNYRQTYYSYNTF